MTTQVLRAPTVSWKKALKPIVKIFADILNAYIEARMAKARYELAQHLVETNADFKGMTTSEVYTKLQSQNTARY